MKSSPLEKLTAVEGSGWPDRLALGRRQM